MTHLVEVSRIIGRALERAYDPEKVALLVAGLEVPHVHLHVSPIWSVLDTDFGRAEVDPDPAALDEAQATILRALAELGHDHPTG